MTITALARTLDQELVALTRGASLACPVCAEFGCGACPGCAAGKCPGCADCGACCGKK